MVDAVLLRNVVKAFGSFTAVDGIDLAIPAGEFFTLLGPSGCGKTTTLRLIAGFEQPTSGSVLIQGREMAGEPAHRRPVNTVFQSYALFPHLDVAANVGFSLSLQRVPAAERTRRVTEALRLVRMEAMAGRKPSELSGGQQQRVALARALVNRPSVLLLDEPLAALDLKLRKEMQMELKHMQRQLGITFILVTHDQEEALTLSDRIAIMKGGRVLQVEDPIGIYERPLTRFGADFIGETNFLVRPIAFREGARIGVSFAGEVVEITAPPGFSGEEVTIALRPEALAIGTGAAGSFRLAGRLKEIIYIGTDRRVVVTLDSGEEVVARVQNSDTAAPLPAAPGTPIDLSCHPSALRALTD